MSKTGTRKTAGKAKGRIFLHVEIDEELRHAVKLAALMERMDLKDWLNGVLRRQVGLDGVGPKPGTLPG